MDVALPVTSNVPLARLGEPLDEFFARVVPTAGLTVDEKRTRSRHVNGVEDNRIISVWQLALLTDADLASGVGLGKGARAFFRAALQKEGLNLGLFAQFREVVMKKKPNLRWLDVVVWLGGTKSQNPGLLRRSAPTINLPGLREGMRVDELFTCTPGFTLLL